MDLSTYSSDNLTRAGPAATPGKPTLSRVWRVDRPGKSEKARKSGYKRGYK